MTTSIMLVTYNRLPLTQRMLESLFQNTDSPFRLIIVDNGSSDGTIEWLKAMPQDHPLCQSYDFHFNEKNLGIACGRNRAMKIADKYNDEWLSTADNDIEYVPNWLTKCLDVLTANAKFAIGLNMEGIEYPLMTLNGKQVQFKSKGNLGTACTVFNRKLHEAIGFFNTEFGLYGEEDADYFIRARVVGWQMGYLPEKGNHFGVGELDTGEYREWKTEQHGINLEKFRATCHQYYQRKKPIFTPYSCPGDTATD